MHDSQLRNWNWETYRICGGNNRVIEERSAMSIFEDWIEGLAKGLPVYVTGEGFTTSFIAKALDVTMVSAKVRYHARSRDDHTRYEDMVYLCI